MIDVVKCSLNTRLIAKPQERQGTEEREFENFLSLIAILDEGNYCLKSRVI